jgi:thioredoxin 2
MFAPTYQNYAEKQSGQILCLKLNTEENQQSGSDYNIRSIPTLALFENGQEVKRISGAMDGNQLHQWVEQHRNK